MAANTQDFRVKHGLVVNETATLSGNVAISGNLTSNIVITGSKLETSGNVSFTGANVSIATSNATISSGNLNITSNVAISGNTTSISGNNLTFTGALANLTSNVSFNNSNTSITSSNVAINGGQLNLSSNLIASGACTVITASNTTIGGGSANITSNVAFRGNTFIITSNTATITGNNLVVNTATFSINAAPSILGNTTITSKSLIITSGDNLAINAQGRAIFGNTVQISNGGLNVYAFSTSDVEAFKVQAANSTGSVTFNVNNSSVDIQGDLNVNGAVTVTTSVLTLDSEEIVFLADETGSPTLDASLTVNRGTSSNVSIKWDETSNKWSFTDDGTSFYPFRTYNSLVYNFSTSTTTNADPGDGVVRFNNASPALVTEIAVDLLDIGSTNVTNVLALFDDSTSTDKAVLIFRSASNPQNFVVYKFSTSINTSTSGVYRFTVTHLSGTPTFTNNEKIFLEFFLYGNLGQQGFQGATGSQGSTGAQGATGSQGATGTQGFQGHQGNQGVTGSQGATGTQGFQGHQGNQGSQGFQGHQGNQGVTGVQGAQGFQGLTGPQGSQGFQGNQGFQGVVGVQGSQGLVGDSTSSGNITSVDDVLSTALYPVMVAAVGSSTPIKTTASKLYFNASTGDLSATNFNSLSDIAYKENVHTISNAIETLESIRGVSFNWKDNNLKSYGVVAQEVANVLPHAVSKNGKGQLTVGYNNLVGLLIEAVKDLKKEINELKK